MKQALINLRGIKAGILTEDEDGYTFQYDTEFLQSDVAEAVSLTLPLTEKAYHDKVLVKHYYNYPGNPVFQEEEPVVGSMEQLRTFNIRESNGGKDH